MQDVLQETERTEKSANSSTENCTEKDQQSDDVIGESKLSTA